MKKYIFLLLSLAAYFLSACTKSSEFELEKSVYHADPDYPSLPAYSEWGYNTFGAYYERMLFVYNDNEIPAKFINTGGITRFILKGQLDQVNYNDDPYYYSGSNHPSMSITFELPGFSPQIYTDLLQLNDTIIDLTGPGCNVSAVIGNDSIDMQLFNGNLQFKRAQHLLVDKASLQVILSGYFDFKALVQGEPISVSYGRFDVGIGDQDFYYY